VKFFTLVVGISVAVVAWLQWRVALNKLRLDLFDRRYKFTKRLAISWRRSSGRTSSRTQNCLSFTPERPTQNFFSEPML
jgi:hypothetical protein